MVNFGSERKDFHSGAVDICIPLECGIISHRKEDIMTQIVHRRVLVIGDLILYLLVAS